MALILILIGFYLDYKNNPKPFISDLKGGVFIFSLFVFSALIQRYWLGINTIYIIFSIGIEIIILFSIKAILNR